MPMTYAHTEIADFDVPRAADPSFQHALDTYASETNKTVSLWRAFDDGDLGFRPHDRSSTVLEIFKHQILSERRFFGEFMSLAEPAASDLLPGDETVSAYAARLAELAQPRLSGLARREQAWWLGRTQFFDVERERVWIFWRRVLHSAHHRAQLTVYLRLLGKPVPPVYGPTADRTWTGADPTRSVEAAGRK